MSAPKLMKAAMLPLAAATFSLAAPANAAVPAHSAATQPASTALTMQVQPSTSVLGDMTFEHGKKHKRRYNRRYRGREVRYDRRYDNRYNQRYSRYGEPVYRSTRVWRGRDGRYYCRRSNGTTGLLIGGAVGALLGREVAGYNGDRTLGAILGAAGGALLGRSIDSGGSRCR